MFHQNDVEKCIEKYHRAVLNVFKSPRPFHSCILLFYRIYSSSFLFFFLKIKVELKVLISDYTNENAAISQKEKIFCGLFTSIDLDFCSSSRNHQDS